MSDFARYTTDDRDLPEDEQLDLLIYPGGNGDWYVSVAPKGKHTMKAVRLSTSGGAQTACPGLCPAIADAYRAMIKAQEA